jgi:hypothetical protein
MYQDLDPTRLENQAKDVMILMDPMSPTITNRIVKIEGQI